MYQELWSVAQAVTYMVYSDEAERSVSLPKRDHLKAKRMAESGTKDHGGHRVRTWSRERAGGGAQVRHIHLNTMESYWSQFD